MYSRRDFGRMLAAAPLSLGAAKPDSKVNGVAVGVQSYSFRDRPLDDAIAAMVKLGISYCELGNNHMEPAGVSREELRKWRVSVPLQVFREARRKFDRAGIRVPAYAYAFRADYTEEEIARGFDMARALGVGIITSSANASLAGRIDRYARKWKIRVGMHNHSNIRPDEFATPDDFAAAMRGRSPYICINLAVGHFCAAGFDPVQFLADHHERVVTLHLKDRKKNLGPNVPFGEGNTPVREILQLLKTKRWDIPAMSEYEYKGADTVIEVSKCIDYCRKALA